MEPKLDLTLFNITDMNPYNLPDKLLCGNLRSTSDFITMEMIGDGSSASVIRAKDKVSNEIVAMKYLKRTDVASGMRKGIFREITILNNLDHVNIIKFHEVVVGSDIFSLCLILEYCPSSLAHFIDKYPCSTIPHSQIKCITKHMLRGLDYLHKNYVIHRDIKPQNLMISTSGVLKIIDFDLSRRYTDSNKKMSPDVITRWYQPPEILLESPVYGTPVDLWSAGCILAELFKKKPILDGRSDIQQINLIIDLIGSPRVEDWPELKECKIFVSYNLKNQPFNKLPERFNELSSDELDLLSGLFVHNPNKRMSARDCLRHDWFQKAPFPDKTIELEESPFLT